ncbi:trimethylamine methyltransferase family protein [Desulfonema magnum]|uniref:Trimethylamine methyltransferase family protein n=1 Tax=Desulfonema magnum TaxID=45655 RepID=A0A975BK91_9BACT|nr:trimethylamine methyltransferase family protein [Desulfonema magnum]QTA86975.1 Trimethylamine methyltransferase family protein [Desulfonema magnum]
MKNKEQIERSKHLLGEDTVNMLFQVHEDAIWVLEDLGVGCKNPEILKLFERFEDEGEAIVFDDRIYITSDLVERCLRTVPGTGDFFVPRNSFFIGDGASYIYDDMAGKGGLSPSAGHAIRIAKLAQMNQAVAGMGKGVRLRDDLLQMSLMAEHCSKPLCLTINSDATLEKAKGIYAKKKNIMAVFPLTHSSLEVNEELSDYFVKVVKAGLPVFISAMPLAGVTAPYCYNGVLAMAHAEVLFGICTAQLIRPGITCIHAGNPTISDPRTEFRPDYGLVSHDIANILMAHLNLMLDIPSCQSAGTTYEEHPTEQAIADVRTGLALCLKYGVHMIRHSFGCLRDFNDFSFAKLEAAMRISGEVNPDQAPEIEMPVYDQRGMESVRRTGLRAYNDDSLTKANLGKIFVN